MPLFFTKEEEVPLKVNEEGMTRLHELECEACPLNNAKLHSPKMPPTGAESPDYYILGEAPGENEDLEGRQFVGKAGQLLRKLANRELLRGAMFDNTLWCRPPKNRTPTATEIECCRPRTIKSIERTRPKAILAMGNTALEWCLGESGIMGWRGRRIPVRIGTHSCWLYPMLHPSYVLRMGASEEDPKASPFGHLLWLDLKRVHKEISSGLEPPEPCPDPPNVNLYKNDLGAIAHWLKHNFEPGMPLGFDIETNCLRPYENGAKILTASIASDTSILSIGLKHSQMKTHSYDYLEALFEAMATASSVVCHNSAFEIEWMVELFGKELARTILWQDTMVQSYCLNESRGMISLDELCLEHLGKRIKQKHNINRAKLDRYPIDDVLKYNGHDAWYALQLFHRQDKIIKESGLSHVYRNQMRRIPTLVLTQQVGLLVDKKKNKEIDNKLKGEINKVKEKINILECVLEFRKSYRREFNPTSTSDMQVILRDVLRLKQFIGKSKFSTDESTLGKIDHLLAKYSIELRKLGKLKGTYVDSLEPGRGKFVFPDGRLHAHFNATKVRTVRLSSSDPNMQNFPKRHDAWIRSQIVAPKGHWFLASDFKQMEVCVIAMGSKDKALIKALLEGHDIHEDWAYAFAEAVPSLVGGSYKTWKNDKAAVGKFRSLIKNQFVFPAFYGAGPTSISEGLGAPLSATDRIWHQFFHAYPDIKAWQETLVKSYMERGYVECLDGFRRNAPTSFNEIINTPIQGSASQIVVNAMDRLSERAEEEERPQLQAVLNIHDDLTFCVPDESMDDDMVDIYKALLSPEFDWISVPIAVEISAGRDWYNLEKIGLFQSDKDL